MPGPRNQRKKKQAQNKKKQQPSLSAEGVPLAQSASQPNSEPAPSNSCPAPLTAPDIGDATLQEAANLAQDYAPEHSSLPPPQVSFIRLLEESAELYVHTPPARSTPDSHEKNEPPIPPSLLKIPFIHDPGNGPRVKDARAFITSSLAAPPSVDDPLCAEFAEEAVFQMLCTVLPEETALVRLFSVLRGRLLTEWLDPVV